MRVALSRATTGPTPHLESDEIQDSLDVDDDIEARGRTAPGGKFYRCATATAKDFAEFRTFKAAKEADPHWDVATITGPENPFVAQEHWRRMQRMDRVEYERRVLAMMHRSPKATYPGWDRKIHLVANPGRFARDIAADVFGLYQPTYPHDGAYFGLGVGHDPGLLKNTSVILRPVSWRKQLIWLIVGDFETTATTQDQHAGRLKQHIQQKFGIQWDYDPEDPDSGLVRTLVITDPHGNGEKHPDDDEYQAFRKHGFDIMPASDAIITRKGRIGMVRRLMKSHTGDTRLYMLVDDRGQPCAPTLLASIEDQQIGEDGIPEKVRKDRTDITHAATALGYFLYPFERELVSPWTRDRIAGVR